MIPTSRAFLTEEDTSLSPVYSTSEPSDGVEGWIQLPISQQTLDHSQSSLIDGIYVQTSQGDVRSIATQEPVSDIESKLAAMAADPDIQREIKLIQSEFDGTEADGLTNDT